MGSVNRGNIQANGHSAKAWKPSNSIEIIAEKTHSILKIRKVSVSQVNPVDIFNRLRNTWAGVVYRNHLKQNTFVRRLVLWTWRNGYPIYANYFANRLFEGKAKKWRPILKLTDYVKKYSIPVEKLLNSADVHLPDPKVFPNNNQSGMNEAHDRYSFPEIYIAQIKNATIYGGTNLVMAGDEVICHDLYDFFRDYTSEELHGRTIIDPKKNRIRLLLHDNEPEFIPIAANFVDACAINYAHWLTEVLPRIILFCSVEKFKNVPIVVNDDLHKNIFESLLLIAGAEREIIVLPIGRALVVGELCITSVAGYVPFERRTNKLKGHSDGVFSPEAFSLLRDRLTLLVPVNCDEVWPEKIFLRRNSGVRRLTNVGDVEKLLLSKGFVIVEPEKLSFLQQVKLFSTAKEIVSSTGAGLVTAICCNPGTHVAVLMSQHKNMIYRYWSNMLFPLGIKVSYALGDIIENYDLGIHGDFKVDTKTVLELLEGAKKA